MYLEMICGRLDDAQAGYSDIIIVIRIVGSRSGRNSGAAGDTASDAAREAARGAAGSADAADAV